MKKKDIYIKILVILGTILIWLPILAPIIFGIILLISDHKFLLDFLMPAELFPLVFLGGILLSISAYFKRLYRKLVISSFVLACTSLVLGQILAVITGLADGDINLSGWQYMLVISSIIIYILGIIGTGVGGVLLFKK